MSKKKLNTRERILAKSLEMFNEKGIEYVGLREIAATLNIRVSNITYYFPTKDDLVNELSLHLNKLNSELIVEAGNMTVLSFLEMLRKVFQNQVRYRCLLLSIVHVMERNQAVSARHKQTQRDRNQALAANLATLTDNGFLVFPNKVDVERLASTISIIARFWISEATISFRELDPEEQISHYVLLIAHLLSPYATEAGRQQMESFLSA